MTKHTKKPFSQPTTINATLETVLKDLSAFFGAAMVGNPEDDWTYQVSNYTYNDVHDWVRNLLTSQPVLSDCIEIEYDEINGEYYFDIVYSRQVSHCGGMEVATIRIENLDTMYAEEVMRATIENARPISERLYFPMK